MFRLYQKIQIGTIGLTGDISCEIVKSRDNFTQTCRLVFPNVLYKNTNTAVGIDNTAQQLTKLISRNDVVKIWSGYNKPFDNLQLKFTGFVNRIEVKENIEVFCEDYAYVLKQINVPSKKFTNATIKEVVEYSLQGANITVDYDDETLKIGDWVIDNNSVLNAVQVFDKLRKFGLRPFVDGSILKIGGLTNYSPNTRNFIFEHNIIEDKLLYRQDDELNIVIKGVSNLDTNEKINRYAYLIGENVQISDAPVIGEQITLNYYNKTERELDEILTNNFDKYIYKGYTGSFTTFLEPYTQINDNINIYSLKYPERNGRYKCKSVATSTSSSGGFQEIELDYKIQDLNTIV